MMDSAHSVYNFYYTKMLYPDFFGIEIIPDIELAYVYIQRNLKNILDDFSVLEETINVLNQYSCKANGV